jgi:lipid-binding SYLF domain-containing protein
MKRKIGSAILAITMIVGFANSGSAESEPEAIVEKARMSLGKIARTDGLRDTVPELIRQSKAVLIFPQLLKAALFIGGEGGSGVLLTRNARGEWSYPAFYTMGALSFGLQIGGQASEAVLVIMTDKGLDAVINNQVKLGAGVSAAIGPVGHGTDISTTTNLKADIYTYSSTKGAFIGGSLEGAVIARREDWNEEFYEKGATPTGILVDQKYSNAKADELRYTLGKY